MMNYHDPHRQNRRHEIGNLIATLRGFPLDPPNAIGRLADMLDEMIEHFDRLEERICKLEAETDRRDAYQREQNERR